MYIEKENLDNSGDNTNNKSYSKSARPLSDKMITDNLKIIQRKVYQQILKVRMVP